VAKKRLLLTRVRKAEDVESRPTAVDFIIFVVALLSVLGLYGGRGVLDCVVVVIVAVGDVVLQEHDSHSGCRSYLPLIDRLLCHHWPITSVLSDDLR